jgi:hypothetical protein
VYAMSDASHLGEVKCVDIVWSCHFVLGILSCRMVESAASKDEADAIVLRPSFEEVCDNLLVIL